MDSIRRFLAVSLLLTITACGKNSPSEPVHPTPTPTSTPTPTPVPLSTAGIFGTVCLMFSHGGCSGPAPGITITITQGAVTLQAVSGTDSSYSFPVGSGLLGPADCKVSAIAPAGYISYQANSVHLTPGLNGPLLIGLLQNSGAP